MKKCSYYEGKISSANLSWISSDGGYSSNRTIYSTATTTTVSFFFSTVYHTNRWAPYNNNKRICVFNKMAKRAFQGGPHDSATLRVILAMIDVFNSVACW